MSKKLILVLGLGLTGLAGCTQGINPTDTDRALIGAGTGAVIADLSGHSAIKGAAVGAAAGALCNDVRLCQ
ncbi:YMGG-like glycine zipper-containing protein [Paracoccus laeviglucosivorans]|uniref:YMGG-like Gly-zipper n=1 Tax=Paracoccus laeviglucosivorans TaxID=1197861 RepID=A0A521C7U7_9RHOB|nr:YMGG-like glycine zipper-containing protein [Paracoccus laeviglucosivorans]SMO55562.1 YMGG-like Gly-zipper [Paracoccus laeviglucosivorans]